MMSISTSDEGAGPEPAGEQAPPAHDPVADSLLDAAFQCVAAFGVRRITLTDVARQAGVSRPTVYRRWPDIATLVADLLTRELHGVFLAAASREDEDGAPSHGRGRLTERAVGVLAELRRHPLMTRILDTEPELLVTYTFQRLGSSQRDALEFVQRQIEAGQADGSVRPAPPAELARMVMLLVQSSATSWRLVDDVLPLDRLSAELRRLLDAHLRPDEAAR